MGLIGGALMRAGKYKLAIATCRKLIDLKKPDSLLYYNVEMLSILNDFNRLRLDHSDRYLEKAEEVLAEAKKKKLAPNIISRMQLDVLDMKMQKASGNGQFRRLSDMPPLWTLSR